MPRPFPTAKINTLAFGFKGGYGHQRRMNMADQHNEIELNFVDRGELILQHGTRQIAISAGQTVIYWAAIPHQVILAQPRTKIAWLVLPLRWFLAWNLPSSLSRQILNGEVLRAVEISHGQPGHLRQWGRDLEAKSGELDKIVELEIEAYFRRLARCYRPTKSKSSSRGAASTLAGNQYAHVQKMVEFMTDHFQEAINVAQIAGAAKVNAEYGMRLFRKCWGMTLWQFLLQQRIFHAQRLLVLGEKKITDIAFSCGFGSLSRFYDAFGKQCLCTPSAYRQKHRTAAAGPHD